MLCRIPSFGLLLVLGLLLCATPDRADAQPASLPAACLERDWKRCVSAGDRLTYDPNTDLPRAAQIFRHACQGNYWDGCFELGWMTQKGDTTHVSYAEARRAYAKACEYEYALGCAALARMQQKARGGPKDMAGKTANMRKACDWGFREFCHEAYGSAWDSSAPEAPKRPPRPPGWTPSSPSVSAAAPARPFVPPPPPTTTNRNTGNFAQGLTRAHCTAAYNHIFKRLSETRGGIPSDITEEMTAWALEQELKAKNNPNTACTKLPRGFIANANGTVRVGNG